jgi:hypothetical protein
MKNFYLRQEEHKIMINLCYKYNLNKMKREYKILLKEKISPKINKLLL